MHCPSVAVLAVLAAGASAATHKVEMGEGGLTFKPDSLKAAKGDTVEFHFDSLHSVVAGDFKKPCEPAANGGFYSGDLPDGKKTTFTITINNTDPIFYYCGVEAHCQGGMVGVINQADDTVADYKSAAEKTDKTTNPKSVFGGSVGDGSSSSSSTTTKGSSSATTTEASAASDTESSTNTASAAATSSTGNVAGHLTGPVAGVSFLALVFGGLLAY
ncbi:extracellular serine-rich [Fusarium albosuccineum]|uniref:Extracellular serine-rich n=1 Tax=Fusarium albosuccineum TaxID=1237068 RepID=A0A8H4P5U0_9HYPO|nr:extracellular serine-rich [Fusarium albosuccineum]